MFFKDNFDKIFGLGFGNCENSSFDIFNSNFYNLYGNYNYRWFTHQWTFLECGYLGIISFILLFICIGVTIILKLKDTDSKNKTYLVTGLCMVVCCVVTIWYNATLKVDMSYLAYFSIAVGVVPLINKKLKIKEGEKKI